MTSATAAAPGPAVPVRADLSRAVLRQERRLLRDLATLAVLSVAGGLAVRRLVRRPDAAPSAPPSGAAPSGAAPSGAAPSGAAPSGAAPSDAPPSGAAPSDAPPADPPTDSPLVAGLAQTGDVARQAVAWGLVDLAIVGWGVRGLLRARRQRLDDAAAAARARRLARITGANAVLDVGYVALGAALAAKVPGRRGDGVGIVVQGLALLHLDVRHAWAFRGLSRAVRDRRVRTGT